MSQEVDPVCGMSVSPETAKFSAQYHDRTYHFCSERCHDRFVADPVAILEPPDPEPTSNDVVYTCPMHPEIEQVGPGTCPLCGMALEPRDAEDLGGEEDDSEYRDMRLRLWVCLLPTVAVFLLAMAEMIFAEACSMC